MGRKLGYGFTAAQRQELWDRYQRGESLKAIARALGKRSSSIYNHLRPTGGIRPVPRKRSRLALTLAEREEISRGIVAGKSLREMARILGRAASTVSREVQRNGGYARYRAAEADKSAWDRARRPKQCKLAMNRPLARRVAAKLKQNWSPEQIASWLKAQYPGDENNQVSHETIYQSRICAHSGPYGVRSMPKPRASGRVNSRILSRSGSGRRAWQSGRCRVTGKGILSPVRGTPTSPPW
jgi:IS30 family transposase